MITPPFNIWASPFLTTKVPVSVVMIYFLQIRNSPIFYHAGFFKPNCPLFHVKHPDVGAVDCFT
jgi:hypothetical protein